MRFAGVDLGSRAVKLAVVDDAGSCVFSAQTDTGCDPLQGARQLLQRTQWDRIIATGYGRGLLEVALDTPTVTEIKAHARGSRACFPGARAVLDIGGQDSKAIAINAAGRVSKFEMNDRCAAGTGKFLEIMAKTLGFDLAAFGAEALQAEKDVAVSSMCTVFAEAEVTSLIAKGGNRREIARGLHLSVVSRVAAMLNRVAADGDLVFTGGVANNAGMCALLAEKLGRKVLVPEQPQLAGALGAALLARESG